MIARWWLKDDVVEQGHWFAGRIDERCSDLSPNGELLLYAAASYPRKPPTWAAISRVPYLTALVMWPGDQQASAIPGAGFFETNHSVILDPFMSKAALLSHKRKLLPYPDDELIQYMAVRHMTDSEDMRRHYCLEHGRLVRDGWQCKSEGVRMVQGRFRFVARLLYPEIYERPSPVSKSRSRTVLLRRTLQLVGEYETKETFDVVDHSGSQLRTLADATWADWQANGDLLFARDGCLYRMKGSLASSKSGVDPMDGAMLVYDFRALVFTKRKPPEWARKWPDGH